jgi:hypothetical protein
MHCLHCGKGFRLASRIFNDPDFCRPTHRWKFHKRLGTAIHFIQRSTELHSSGQAGFRSEVVFFDCLHQATVLGPTARAQQSTTPSLHLAITGEALPLELYLEKPADVDEPMPSAETTDRRARLERFSAMMTQLRDDVQRRRSDAAGNAGRTLAPVVELPVGQVSDQPGRSAGRRPAPQLQALRTACT